MSPADEMAAKPDAEGSEKSDQQLRAIFENLERAGQRNPVVKDDLHSRFFTPYPDQGTSEGKAIYDRLAAIENEIKRRHPRGFRRYLVAKCFRVARRMLFTIRSDADSACTDFCLISTP
jgi:hypothetical protein